MVLLLPTRVDVGGSDHCLLSDILCLLWSGVYGGLRMMLLRVILSLKPPLVPPLLLISPSRPLLPRLHHLQLAGAWTLLVHLAGARLRLVRTLYPPCHQRGGTEFFRIVGIRKLLRV